jgi:aspartate/methionine/tyrosine aminotransferase
VPEDPFPYMRWAKTHLHAAWGGSNLGMSGVRPPSETECAAWGLPPLSKVGEPEKALKSILAAQSGIPPEGIYLTAGTSHANFIACLALARGGRLAVETPAYEALPRLGLTVGAEVVPLPRSEARGWRFDADALAEAVGPETNLLLVTDLHNPTGQRLEAADLDLLIEAAERAEAWLLVDEVYQAFDPEPRRTAALRHPRVLTTNSLTKVHGLGDLRCGWILGDPEVIARIAAWDDLVHPQQPPASLAAAACYLPHAAGRVATLREEAAARIAQVDAWVDQTAGVTWTVPAGGMTGLLSLATDAGPGNGDRVAARVYADAGVRVVPGSFFQCPSSLRISYQLEAEDLDRALGALGRAIAEEGA